MNVVQYRSARAEDLGSIQNLLKESELPWEDAAEHLPHFIVAEIGEEIVGVVGLEVYGTSALLRSFAVKESSRGMGLGRVLYEKIISFAHMKGLQELSLLTTTAEGFFTKRGFEKVASAKIPAYVRETKEYKLFCSTSAVCMRINLDKRLA